MSIFNIFKKESKQVQGKIGYFGLSDWWLSNFSVEEREHIIKTFQPFGSSGESLIKGNIASTSETPNAAYYQLLRAGLVKKMTEQ